MYLDLFKYTNQSHPVASALSCSLYLLLACPWFKAGHYWPVLNGVFSRSLVRGFQGPVFFMCTEIFFEKVREFSCTNTCWSHMPFFPHHLQIMCLILFSSTETARRTRRNQVNYSLEISPFCAMFSLKEKYSKNPACETILNLHVILSKNTRKCGGKGLKRLSTLGKISYIIPYSCLFN